MYTPNNIPSTHRPPPPWDFANECILLFGQNKQCIEIIKMSLMKESWGLEEIGENIFIKKTFYPKHPDVCSPFKDI